MIITVITPPAPIVTLDEAKAHLRVRHSHEDQQITNLVAAATGWIDGPAGWLGRALGEQTLAVTMDGFCGDRIKLPLIPAASIVEIGYVDTDQVAEVVDPTAYGLDGRYVYLKGGRTWPATGHDPAAVTIRYVAGYEVGKVPEPIRQAILLLVGHWFQNREAVVVGTISGDLPLGVEPLLTPYRVWF